MRRLFDVSLASVTISVAVGVFIFQDSITRITNFSALNYLDECAVALLLCYTVLQLLSGKRIPQYTQLFFWLALLFWLTGVISGIANSMSYLRTFTFLMGGFLMMKCFIVVLALAISPPSLKILRHVRNGILFWGWVSVFSGLLNVFAYPAWHAFVPYVFNDQRMGITSAMGLFIHPGQYGWFMTFCALIYLAEHYQLNSPLWKALVMFCCGLLSMKVKVIVTLIVIILFCAFFIIPRKARLGKLVAAFSVLAVIAVVFGSLLQTTFAKYFTDADGESARYSLLVNSGHIMVDYFPLGVGFSQYGSWYARVNYSEYYRIYGMTHVYGLEPSNPGFATDTFWPAIIGETGALGTILYIGMLIVLMRMLFLRFRVTFCQGQISSTTGFMTLFALFALIQAVCESTGEPIFNSSPQNLFIGGAVGVALAFARQTTPLDSGKELLHG